MLVRRPGNGLHCSIVVAELDDRGCGIQIPDVQLVVITTAGNLSVIWGPFQATHLSHDAGIGDKMDSVVVEHCHHHGHFHYYFYRHRRH